MYDRVKILSLDTRYQVQFNTAKVLQLDLIFTIKWKKEQEWVFLVQKHEIILLNQYIQEILLAL